MRSASESADRRSLPSRVGVMAFSREVSKEERISCTETARLCLLAPTAEDILLPSLSEMTEDRGTVRRRNTNDEAQGTYPWNFADSV